MTEQEAINNFKIIEKRWLEDENMFSNTMEIEIDDEFIKTIDKGIEALEKQTPKDVFHYEWNGIDGVPYDLCPNCKSNLCTAGLFGRSKKYISYCSNCGQAIKWESEE